MRLVTTPEGEAESVQLDDRELLRLWREGRRRRAIELLARRDSSLVYAVCFRSLRDRSLAEDVMQQVFIEACRDFEAFRGKSSLRAWLLGITAHRCLDTIKRLRAETQRREPHEPDVALQRTPDETPIASDRLDLQRKLRALDDCLGGLSTEVRTTVLLRYQSGLSYEQLAQKAGQQPATLQARVARALPVLRRCLEGKGFEP